jgi:simple sugar transport system permease protein
MPEIPDFRKLQRRPETWLAAVIIIVAAGFSVTAPGFLTLANIIDLLETYSVQSIMAMGLFVVLVSGGIDISFAATASVAQYVTALLATQTGLPPFVCLGSGLLVGIALGCLNALLIHFIRITSIIATIAMMSVSFSFLMYFSQGKSIYTLPEWWTDRIVFWETEAPNGDLTRITLPIVVMIVAAILTWLFMTRTKTGRQLYTMGGNPEAARRIGVNVAKLQFVAYGFLGFMAAVGGLLQAHRVGESVPNAMYNTELSVLSAAVLGGASLTGGIGTVPGVLLGIVLLAMLQNGLNLLGVSSYFFQIVIGLTILISTSITVISARKRRRHLNPVGGLVHG